MQSISVFVFLGLLRWYRGKWRRSSFVQPCTVNTVTVISQSFNHPALWHSDPMFCVIQLFTSETILILTQFIERKCLSTSDNRYSVIVARGNGFGLRRFRSMAFHIMSWNPSYCHWLCLVNTLTLHCGVDSRHIPARDAPRGQAVQLPNASVFGHQRSARIALEFSPCLWASWENVNE